MSGRGGARGICAAAGAPAAQAGAYAWWGALLRSHGEREGRLVRVAERSGGGGLGDFGEFKRGGIGIKGKRHTGCSQSALRRRRLDASPSE